MRICKNTTTVIQVLQKEKFHFCQTREEKTYDQKYLARAMGAPPVPELDGITALVLL